MKGKLSRSIFWALIIVFIVLAISIFTPPAAFAPAFRGGLFLRLFASSGAAFFLLGVALIVLTVKERVQGILKIFLILTGASAVGLPVFVLLHNAVSGLFNTEESVLFIMATIVCTIAFLVGVVGSVVLAIKSKQAKHSSQNS
ncbi:hypothetical protein ACFLUW_02795 [Chloroflexota bacterium]